MAGRILFALIAVACLFGPVATASAHPVDGSLRESLDVVRSTGLGIRHVSEGADHLLFLLMLLIPAPLVARRRRWVRREDGRAAAVRVVHVTAAFAVGHSTTLVLASLGVVSLPTRVVESLIALSIFVSAAHVLRPLVRSGEAVIAVGFGLVHGLAFADVLAGYGSEGGVLLSTLAGFNLGIEVTQLLVVALMMPSLYLLSRTAAYPAIRIGMAGLGLLLSGGWLLERTALILFDPLEAVSEGLVSHPFVVAAAFALAAGMAHWAPVARLRVGGPRG